MAQRSFRLIQADAFADGPFTGNPAAVCLLPGRAAPRAPAAGHASPDTATPAPTMAPAWSFTGVDDALLQAIAAEMNLSETAFLQPIDSEGIEEAADVMPTSRTGTHAHNHADTETETGAGAGAAAADTRGASAAAFATGGAASRAIGGASSGSTGGRGGEAGSGDAGGDGDGDGDGGGDAASGPDAAFARCTYFLLRWLTPLSEVDLCGHATLATAAVLFDVLGNAAPRLRFNTRSGDVECERDAGDSDGAGGGGAGGGGTGRVVGGGGAGRGTRVRMRFPLNPPVRRPATEPATAAILSALLRPDPKAGAGAGAGAGVTGAGAGASALVRDVLYDARTRKLVVRLAGGAEGRAALSALTPDHAAMLAVDQSGASAAAAGVVCGVSVTCRGNRNSRGDAAEGGDGCGKEDSSDDFVSRYFNPWVGINEDPANGSSHTLLAPYWTRELGRAPGTTLAARMLSQRGGLLAVSASHVPDDSGRVAATPAGEDGAADDGAGGVAPCTYIGGTAAVVLDGRLLV